MSKETLNRVKKYLSRVKCLIKNFKEASFLQIPREENMEAGALTKEASADGSVDEFDEVQYMHYKKNAF